MGGAVAASLAARRPDRVATLTLIALRRVLGQEINATFIDGIRACRPAQGGVEACCDSWCTTPSLVSRTMVEDVLRYKRLDGVARRWRRSRAPGSPAAGRR